MKRCRCQHQEALEEIVFVASYYPWIQSDFEMVALAVTMDRIAKRALGQTEATPTRGAK